MTTDKEEVTSREVSWKDSLVTRVNGVTITILIILIAGLGLIINNIVSDEITQSVHEQNMEIATSLKKDAEAFFSEGASVMKLLSYHQDVKEANIEKMKDVLDKVRDSHPYFRTLYLGTKNAKMYAQPKLNLPEGYDPTQRPWYKKAKAQNKVTWSDIYKDAETNNPIITVAIPINDENGNFVGVLGGDVSLETLSNSVVNRKIGEEGYAYLVNKSGKLIAHPDQEKVNNEFDINQVFDIKSALEKDEGKLEYDFGGKKLASYVEVPTIDGAVFAQVPAEEAYQARGEIRSSILIFSVLIVVVLSTVIYYINKKYLIKPVRILTQKIAKIADGNFAVETNLNRSDELGSLEDALSEMTASLRDVIINLADTIEDLSAYSQELSASAEEGNATIDTTNELIENMSASIEQISASAQEVTSFAQESNSQTEVGRDKIEKTVNNIEEINQSVDKTVTIINDLDETSEEIGQIVEMITNIAEQTNLLALNAAIEAARAGEHGQGFAVVAEEIRELAEDTGDATDKISNLINKTQEKSETGLKAIKEVKAKAEEGQEVAQETGQVFAQIEESAEETSAQIEQTASATQDLAQSSQEISNAGDDIQNMSEEISNSSQELANMAQKLQSLVEEFKV